jgi:hypothetical protein
MTDLQKIANESVELIKLRMEFMTTQQEIDSAVRTINQIRNLVGA